MYSSDKRVTALAKYFASIVILISCLGLFGLAAFAAQRRQKEISIRKVVSASVGSIVVMLIKDFLKLVAIAVLTAFPLAWLVMNQWLNGFAYRVNTGFSVSLFTGMSIVLILLHTISYRSVKAAIANPVKSLRID